MKSLFQIFVIGALACIIWCVPLSVFLTTLVSAQVPQMINYQGKLTTNTGAPVNDTLQMVFTIYSDSGGTNPLWTETQSAVLVEKGVFNVLLGSVDSIPYSVFDGSIRYLGVKIGDDPEITPRKLMVSVGYAFHSSTADTAKYSMPDADWTIVGDTIYHLNGNVGIGTTSPQAKVTVVDSKQVINLATGTNTSSYALDIGVNDDGVNIQNDSYVRGFNFKNRNGTLVTITAGGDVGIGTTSPDRTLDVNGSLRTNGNLFSPSRFAFYTDAGAAQTIKAGALAITSSYTYNPPTNGLYVQGKVGIGTTEPEAGLHVLHNSNVEYAFKVQNNGGSALGVEITGGANSATPLLNVHSAYSGGDRQGLRVQSNGNVGIGTTTPAAKLDVAGHTRTEVLEITGGRDLAERFEVRQSKDDLAPQPGMVVCIDPAQPGQLVVSSKAYDPTVAGIISGAGDLKPGMLMGQQSTIAHGEYPVALTGRAWCLADVSYGSVQPGDFLTTSDTPGHAMKVKDMSKAQGAIIGKAMTSLSEGRGLVLVLVNLQ
jgi:hypothetical protein